MKHTAISRRLTIIKILALPVLLSVVLIPGRFIAEETATTSLFLRPHCAQGTTPCPTFAVEDPETLRTPAMEKDDILHMDLIAINPDQKKIARVRSWIQYNPAVLEGMGITAGTALPTAAPGEINFSTSDGLIKIDLSARANEEPADEEIVVARIQLKVKSIPTTQTDVLSFYDVQPTDHTRVVAKKTDGTAEDILTQNPGSLLVAFAAASSSSAGSQTSTGSGSSASSVHSGSGSSASSTSKSAGSGSSLSSAVSSAASSAAGPICGNGLVEVGEQCDDGNFLAGDGCSITCTREAASSTSALTGSGSSSAQSSNAPQLPDGSACTDHAACKGGLCSSGICRGDFLKVEDGGACNTATQCLSGVCQSNRCGGAASSAASFVSLPQGQSAFALLQVRSVRITTEGTSLYVAWDPLASSQLKAYNLYYGTTSGRYIQRKTVSAESTSMAIRNLPEKTTYFVAIRALSLTDEESAFSQEVAVEVGNPKTSTSPLTGDLMATRKPVTVPGETGMPSVIALLLTLSAVTGTAIASRRQAVALTAPPRSR